jgi:hypothetical protein
MNSYVLVKLPPTPDYNNWVISYSSIVRQYDQTKSASYDFVPDARESNCSGIDYRCLIWEEPLFTPSACHGIDLDGNLIESVTLDERPLDTFCRQWFTNMDVILDTMDSIADLRFLFMFKNFVNQQPEYVFQIGLGTNIIPGIFIRFIHYDMKNSFFFL